MLPRALAQGDIWHVEAGRMRTRVIAYPVAFSCGTPMSYPLPVLRRVSSTRGGARPLVGSAGAPGGRSRGRSTKTRVIFPIPLHLPCTTLPTHVHSPMRWDSPSLQRLRRQSLFRYALCADIPLDYYSNIVINKDSVCATN